MTCVASPRRCSPGPRCSPWSARTTMTPRSPRDWVDRHGADRHGADRHGPDDMIKVGVLGAKGRMGSEVCQAVDEGDSRDALAGCDVVVDFTHPGVVMDNLRWCIGQGLDTVVGTSGFDESRTSQVTEWLADAPATRALVVPNFSFGAVLMMRFAAQAARFFDSAEIVELHHARKVDAPSGTAARTASLIAEARRAAGLGPSPDATVSAADGARGAIMDGV